jgi:pantoate--beta-alanine ligase
MQVIEKVEDMQIISHGLRADGKSIGLVPTMGAIHEGHRSLVRRSGDENDVTVVSIFVNPIQFGPGEDFDSYPRDLENDLVQLSSVHADIVFVPDASEMFKEGNTVTIDVGEIGERLCGVKRPGHFNGVATVVAKLFNIVIPKRAYFGQKDYQQALVVRRMARGLNYTVHITTCPTVREDDGLVVSSRNRHLDRESRAKAAILYRALLLGCQLIREKGMDDASRVRKEIEGLVRTDPSVSLEYVEIVDHVTLLRCDRIKGGVLIALAAMIGDTRLIDNMLVDERCSSDIR